MPITEEKALEILAELIKKPESKAEEIPRIWGEIIVVYNTQFAPPAEEPKKKRRRKRAGGVSPNLGWPAGVSRAEYKAWKGAMEAKGVKESLNPQEYKRQRDAGLVKAAPAAAPKAEAKPAPEAKGKKAPAKAKK